MELPLKLQLMQALASLSAGALLGFVHDLLAVLRLRVRKAAAVFCDLVLGAVIWMTFFTLGLWLGGGRQRLFYLVFAAMGAGLYLLLLAPLLRPLLGCSADAAAWVLHGLTLPLRACRRAG